MKTLSIFILIVFCIPLVIYGQMQKIFYPSRDSILKYGYCTSIDNVNNEVMIKGVGEVYGINKNKATILKRTNKKWNIFYEFNYDNIGLQDFGSNYSNGKFIKIKTPDAPLEFDTIVVHNKISENDYAEEYKINTENLLILHIYLHNDWIFFKGYKENILENKMEISYYFYHYENGGYKKNTEFKYITNYAQTANGLGRFFDMTDEYAVLGEYLNSEKGKRNGKVIIFKNTGVKWEILQELYQPDPYYKSSIFGGSVSISPNNKYIAIFSARDSTGLVDMKFNKNIYIYKNNGVKYELMQKLSNRDKAAHSWDANINNEDLLISMPMAKPTAFEPKGMILQYKLQNGKWEKYREIHPPPRDTTYFLFGWFTDYKGETAVTGSVSDTTYFNLFKNHHLFTNGAAYIFQIPARDTLHIDLCRGDSYVFNDTVISTGGHYVDTLIASYGVDSVVQLYVTMHETYDISIDTVLCQGESITIGDRELSEAGYYDIGMTSINGCDSIVHLRLEYDDMYIDTVDITPDYGCGSGAIYLTVTGDNPPYVFEWDSGATGEEITGLTSGEYSLTIIDKLGCEYEYEYEIPDSIPYIIPNVFFPDGQEEINKRFRIYTAKDVSILSTELYDRWGKKVYTSEGKQYWDGTYKGNPMSPGIYLYKITIKSLCGIETLTEQVLLSR